MSGSGEDKTGEPDSCTDDEKQSRLNHGNHRLLLNDGPCELCFALESFLTIFVNLFLHKNLVLTITNPTKKKKTNEIGSAVLEICA